ncbi:TOBE domain-containing protein, partial [Haladaptatus sp.]|uniref:TOBE domain-containing protein n=1 Tax=Haladaptatus sp. TaxID=1973141 RepID=UPI003C6939A8
IRPEEFVLANGRGPIEGEIVERYFQGDQTNYIVNPDSDSLSDVRVVMQGRESPVSRGERATFDVRDGAPVVFEA